MYLMLWIGALAVVAITLWVVASEPATDVSEPGAPHPVTPRQPPLVIRAPSSSYAQEPSTAPILRVPADPSEQHSGIAKYLKTGVLAAVAFVAGWLFARSGKD